jgi:ankyrin repeat protein
MGYNGVHILCMLGHLSALETYIGAKGGLECEDRLGRRPIHLAAEFGRFKCVELLLEYHVDTNCLDKVGMVR